MGNVDLLLPFTLWCCHVGMLYPTCEIISDYLGTIFPVLYTVFRTKLSSELQN